jgi:hypothetical protein
MNEQSRPFRSSKSYVLVVLSVLLCCRSGSAQIANGVNSSIPTVEARTCSLTFTGRYLAVDDLAFSPFTPVPTLAGGGTLALVGVLLAVGVYRIAVRV